jgi:hypothetical protein
MVRSYLVQAIKQAQQKEQRLKNIEGLKAQIEQQKSRLELLEGKKSGLIVELKTILKDEERQKRSIPPPPTTTTTATTPIPGLTEDGNEGGRLLGQKN